MGAWFPKDKGGGYLTYEPMGRIQMSIKEPKRVDNCFLVLFDQPLNSPRSSWAVIALGKGEHGQLSNLTGPSVLTTCMPKGGDLIQFPSHGGDNPILHSCKKWNFLMHSRSDFPHGFGELLDIFQHPYFINVELSCSWTLLGFYPSCFEVFPHPHGCDFVF